MFKLLDIGEIFRIVKTLENYDAIVGIQFIVVLLPCFKSFVFDDTLLHLFKRKVHNNLTSMVSELFSTNTCQ
jgi:hypothetical protein